MARIHALHEEHRLKKEARMIAELIKAAFGGG